MPYADTDRNREYHREYQRKWRADAENKHSIREYDANRYANDPDHRRRMRNRNLLRWYGITLEEYEQMIVDQNGRCAICDEAFVGSPHVDHCHQTGTLRALLCPLCNKGLGQFRDDLNFLRQAVAYLERYQ